MPTLGLLQCHVKWLGCDRPIAEHNTQYHDSRVETWLPVPLNPTPFYCQLTSDGWIANGLSAFVYIDGEYMCNRTKPNITPPGPAVNPASSCVNFKLRQKEITMVDGQDWGMPWLFSQVNAAPAGHPISNSVPWGGQHVGTIEVVVLRHAPDATDMPRGLATSAKRSHLEGQAQAPSYKGPPRFGLDGGDDNYEDEAHPSKRANVMCMDGDPGTGPGDVPWNWDAPDAPKEDKEVSPSLGWGGEEKSQQKQPVNAEPWASSNPNKTEDKGDDAPTWNWGGGKSDNVTKQDSSKKPAPSYDWGGAADKDTIGAEVNKKKATFGWNNGANGNRPVKRQSPRPEKGKSNTEKGQKRVDTSNADAFGEDNTVSGFDWATNTGEERPRSPHLTAFNGSGDGKSNDKKAENNNGFGWGDSSSPAPSKRDSKKSVAGISVRGSQAGSRRGSVPIQNITINVAAGGSALIGPPQNGSTDRATSPPTSETGWGGRKSGLADRSNDSSKSKMPGAWGDDNDENDPSSFDTGAVNDETDGWGNSAEEKKKDDWSWGGNAENTQDENKNDDWANNQDQNQTDDWGATADNNDENKPDDDWGATTGDQTFGGNSWGNANNDNSGNGPGDDKENQESFNDNAPGFGQWDTSNQDNQNANETNNTGDGWNTQPDTNGEGQGWGNGSVKAPSIQGSPGQGWGGSQKGNAFGAEPNDQAQQHTTGSQNGHGEHVVPQQPTQTTQWGDANHNTGGNPSAQPVYIKVVPQMNSIPSMQARQGLFPGRSPQPYWAAWSQAQDKNAEMTRPVFEPNAGAQPVSSLPIEVIERNNTTHQVQLGAASTFTRRKFSPKYLDTMDKPFAVFTFHYRDQATLSSMTGTNICESRTEEAERLSQLSSDELLQIMYGRLDAARKGEGPSAPPVQAPAPTLAPQYSMSGAQPAPAPEQPTPSFGQATSGSFDTGKLSDKHATVVGSQKGDIGHGWGGETSDENAKPAEDPSGPPGPPGPPGGDSDPGSGGPGGAAFDAW